MNKRDLLLLKELYNILPEIRLDFFAYSESSKKIRAIKGMYVPANEYKIRKREILEVHEPIVNLYCQKVNKWNSEMNEIFDRNNYMRLSEYLVLRRHFGKISPERSFAVAEAAKKAKILVLVYIWIPPHKYSETNVYPVEWLDIYFQFSANLS